MTSSKVLALKYRPQRFGDVKGQDHVVSALMTAINQECLPHSLIFSGVRGTGKTTLARLVAKRLNCENPVNGDACDACASCIAIKENRHLDVLEVDGASYTGVDHIREIIESAQYKAVMGKYRVFIIDEAHMLSKSAFNALLKNLEEPADHVCYILATTELHKIPDTILSRCMRCQMAMFSIQQLVETQTELLLKENIQFDEAALFDIAYAADGSMRDVQTLLNQTILLSKERQITKETTTKMLGLSQRQELYTLLESLLAGEVDHVLQHSRQLIGQGVSGHTLLSQLMDLTYWLCCIKSTPHLKLERSYPDLERTKGSALADQIDLPKLHMVWQILQKGYQEYMASPLKNPTLEMILMRLCFVQDLKLNMTPVQEEQSQQKWTTLESLLKHVRQQKEPLLYEQLAKTYPCISYTPGELVLKGEENKAVSLEIINKLNQLTKMSWRVSIRNEESTPSAAPHHDPQPSLPHITDPELPDVVADLVQAFPNMVITINA